MNSKKEIVKHCVAVSILIIIISAVITVIIRYQVDGETNMPFNLSKMIIVCTAEDMQGDMQEGEEQTRWNLDIYQSNDIYFFIDKNEDYKKTASIDSVTIENINISTEPIKGTVKSYMPNSKEGSLYVYSNEYLVDDKLTYTGAKVSNEKTLEIGNQGGKALIRFANTNIGNYKSNDDTEIANDGTLLSKINATNEEVEFSVNFDFIIKVGNIKYKANITLDLPYDNIIEKGTTQIEKTDMSDIIFKRCK